MNPLDRQLLKEAVNDRRRELVFTTDSRGRQILKYGYRNLDGTTRPGVAHGTHYGYQQGCRCEVCRDGETARSQGKRRKGRV